MDKLSDLIKEMMVYYSGDVKRINHFLKVHSFAKIIGEGEQLNNLNQEILEVASVVHDIGIKISEEKYNSSAGKYQQVEGPPIADEMLARIGYNDEIIARVHYLIAHHHTYDNINEMDYQILVEADFLVNIYEDGMAIETIKKVKESIFKTKSGKMILDQLYLVE
jgi:HD superfamily phosphodiesterase